LKKIIIIAGANGAGKTTFARDFFPAEARTLRFINADLIAAGLAPFKCVSEPSFTHHSEDIVNTLGPRV
jgi:predicted ABC-type ATPase